MRKHSITCDRCGHPIPLGYVKGCHSTWYGYYYDGAKFGITIDGDVCLKCLEKILVKFGRFLENGKKNYNM